MVRSEGLFSINTLECGLTGYCTYKVLRTSLFGAGCLVSIDTSEYWILYLMLLVQETSMPFFELHVFVPFNLFRTVMFLLVLIKAFYMSKNERSGIPALCKFIAIDGMFKKDTAEQLYSELYDSQGTIYFLYVIRNYNSVKGNEQHVLTWSPNSVHTRRHFGGAAISGESVMMLFYINTILILSPTTG